MTLTIATALQEANQQLVSHSDTPMLDAEILLAWLLQVSRSYLFAFPERELTSDQTHSFANLIHQRMQHVPIAYLTGHKEFWSLDLQVTADTLIPRPETELLVECVLRQVIGENKEVLDLGTGSGAIALALAYERPSWEVHASDKSVAALKVAQLNAAAHKLSNVIFYHGDWFAPFPLDKKFDVIVSNPPYIAADDPYLEYKNLRHEPQSALIAEENGLKDLREIIASARQHLQKGGTLWLEHGFLQSSEIRRIFLNMDYSDIDTYQDLAGLDRVTGGRI